MPPLAVVPHLDGVEEGVAHSGSRVLVGVLHQLVSDSSYRAERTEFRQVDGAAQ
jgi:hypothetical protein